jgi:glycosyltransferase involved in cell wall biosynthesis
LTARREQSQMTEPLVSVAVSTYRRAHLLPRLIRALKQQTLPHGLFEVVIADNGSPDGTQRVLEELGRESSVALRSVRVERNRGPAAGRNAAWRACRGEIVAFTDDDCVPTPEWLERGLEAMRSAGVVVGRTIPAPDQLKHEGAFSRTVRVDDARFFQTCNVFYARADLEVVGGFDERFSTPAGEDTDLGLRVVGLDRVASFAPDAVVHHDVRPSSFRATVRETLRWYDIPRVMALHPGARSVLHRRFFWRRTHPPVLLAAAALGVGWRWPIALVLTMPWLSLRLRRQPLDRGRVRRFVVLPGAFVIDLLEVGVMLRGSIKHRALVL